MAAVAGGNQGLIGPRPGEPPLTLKDAVEWRPFLWESAVRCAMDLASDVLTPGATVLEVGYNSGLMTCYLALTRGVHVVGYETRPEAQARALRNCAALGIEDRVDFRLCDPAQTLSLTGSYDAVLLKSVLYHISDPQAYRAWLRWLRGILRPGGALVAVENGRGGRPIRLYRKLIRSRRYADFCLMDGSRLDDVCAVFDHVDARFFGRVSPFFEPLPGVREGLRRLEDRVMRPSADAHFVAAVVARRAADSETR